MEIRNGDVPLMQFDFGRGRLRGSSLMLYPSNLVHRSSQHLETVPLAALAAVRIEFARDARKIKWGVALLVVALILFAIAGPLASLAGAAAEEVAAAQSGSAGIVQSTMRGLGAAARMLPYAGALLVISAAGLGALGWLGHTTLTLTLGAVERGYPVFGRELKLFDFAEALGERLRAIRH